VTKPRKPYTPPPARHIITIESAGNARITDRSGHVVGVMEDWTLFVDGRRIGDVGSYHEAMTRTQETLGI